MQVSLTLPDDLYHQLIAIGNLLTTQDNAITADPIWLVFDKTRKREDGRLKGIFLTENAAKKWVSANRHYFEGEPYIFIDSLWRNAGNPPGSHAYCKAGGCLNYG